MTLHTACNTRLARLDPGQARRDPAGDHAGRGGGGPRFPGAPRDRGVNGQIPELTKGVS